MDSMPGEVPAPPGQALQQDSRSPGGNGDVIRQTLLADASLLITARQAGLATADRVYALSFTLLAAALGLFASNSAYRFLVLPVPFLLCLLLAYQLQVSADVKVMGIYRAYLEVSINEILGDRVLGYENGAARARSGSYSFGVRYIGILLLVTLLALAVVFGIFCADLYGLKSLQFWVYVVATAAALVGVVICVIDEQKSRKVAHGLLNKYRETGEGLMEANPPQEK
jgi:hypothetical protein